MEILGLRWNDIDLPHALKLIKKHAKIRNIDSDLIFPVKNPKTPIELKKQWAKVLEEANITDFRFHDLRHSAASYLAMNGSTIAEIVAVLGHKTLQMVKRYAHLSEAHTAKFDSLLYFLLALKQLFR